MQKKLGRHTVVLLGIGHTNAHILRMWKMKPIPNAQLVCVSDFPIATYSGMLPGVLAGQYPVEAMEIDLVRLSNSAGARLVIGKVSGLELEKRQLLFADRPPLKFDLLSIGIGSRPSFKNVEVASESGLIAVKPMQTFLRRLREKFASLNGSEVQNRIAIVGGGLGSIEIAFCLHNRMQTDPSWLEMDKNKFPEITLITGSQRLGSGLLESTAAKVTQQLDSCGIKYRRGLRVAKIGIDTIEFSDGTSMPADIVVWATSAVAPPMLKTLNLETDEAGFLSTRPTLQTKTDDRVFAVGDTGTIIGGETAKAGVFAVRQGPILWRNIKKSLRKQALESYEPQRGFLKLINTGNDRAIAEYRGRSYYGRWCWKLKDYIDLKFMKMYQDYSLMEMKPEPIDDESAMRCLGCGGKIGSQILSQVLSELEVPPHDDVIIGLEQPDDAAVIKTADNQVTVTTDFFAAPFDDPYLVGRIATLNSASDCFVMGAQPTAALAIVQLPLGHPRAQMQVMHELMAGSVCELKKMGATIVGGHSIEGPRTMIGYTILGKQIGQPMTKGGLSAGDQLILTKPLGTGVLLAALMQSKLHGRDYPQLMSSMLQSNQIALDLIRDFPISAITDVTGFGLAGHLAEMLMASKKSASIAMDQVPLLSGCQELINGGVESTLAEDNRAVAGSIELVCNDLNSGDYASLFDPQTGGGLLFGIAESQVDPVVSFLGNNGFDAATCIGIISNSTNDSSILEIVALPNA